MDVGGALLIGLILAADIYLIWRLLNGRNDRG